MVRNTSRRLRDSLTTTITSNIDYRMTLDSLIETLSKISVLQEVDVLHGERTAATALKIGRHLELDEDKLKLLGYAARIHDLGRIAIDDSIVTKAGSLTASERGAMEQHPLIGYNFLSRSNLPPEITLTLLYHQEHFDGSGYPKGLTGFDIPLFSRIVCIADVWDALVSDRPYRKAMPKITALQEMDKMARFFDPALYKIFLAVTE